jgi:ADP-heptose:LPS heptosyltransferase
VNKRVYDLVSDYSNINKVHAIEKVTVSSVRRIAKENNYDLAIVVSPSFATAFGLFLGGVKYRLGTAYRWYSFFFNIRHHQHRKDSIKHELEYNLDLLEELNLNQISYLKPVIKVEDYYAEKVKTKLLTRGIDTSRGFIVVHVPSLGSAKVWSDANFAKLIMMILQDENLKFNIILSGTKQDEEQVTKIVDLIGKSDRVFTVLDLDLRELAALLKMSKLLISNSTGPIHIAAAVGTFVFGLYSPVKVESPTRWGPYTDRKKVFVPPADDDSRDVMDDIKPEVVYDFVKNFVLNNKN